MKFYTACAIKGNKILVRGYKGGVRFTDTVSFQPSLFIQSTKESNYKTLNGIPVKRMRFKTLYDCREFLKQYEDLNDSPIFGNTDFVTQYLLETYESEILYDLSKIKVAYFDIETETEGGFPDLRNPNEKINLIGVRISGVNYLLSCKQVSIPDCNLILVASEKELIQKFFELLKKEDIDVITGWNVKLFDIPYIIGRARLFFEDSEIQSWLPFNILKERETNIGGVDYRIFEFPGYTILDYMDLYKKFSGTSQESYALNFIAKAELDAQKLDYAEYGSLREFYTKNFQRFAEYNIQDVQLVEQLDNKLRLIDLAVSIAYEAKIPFDVVFFATRIWGTICCDYLMRKNIIPPIQTTYAKDDQFVGAYVKEVAPGLYKNVVSFDATSLYPSIIMGWNISPETCTKKDFSLNADDFLVKNQNSQIPEFIQEAESLNSCLACNGSMFSNEVRGFIPILIERTFNQRKEAKNKMLELEKEYENTKDSKLLDPIAALKIRQSVKKILANSLYGCLGNPAFIYSSPELATAVTVTGQVIIRTAENGMNSYIRNITKNNNTDYVIAVDTDSVYLNLDEIVTQIQKKTKIGNITDFIDDVCEKKIQPELKKEMDLLSTTLNCSENKIFFKREAIASAGMFIAKKRYALLVQDLEGVRFEEPKLKIMGLETARSSTPAIVRRKLKDCIKIILTKTPEELRQFVNEFYDEFMQLPISEIAAPRGVKGIKKYSDASSIYKSGTPIATKAALLYNAHTKKLQIDKDFPSIKENDKIKFVFVKVPNPYGMGGRDAVMGFINSPPEKFELESYIDRKKQFTKTFEEPLENILQAINWKLSAEITLESFFV